MLRFTLWAQRRARWVPAPVRRLAGRTIGRLRAGDGAVSGPELDWSVPLVAGRLAGNIEVLAAARRDDRLAAVTMPARPTLRCVIASDVLDVGGMDEFVGFLGHGLPRVGVETVVVYRSGQQAGTQGEGGAVVRALDAAGVPTVRLSEEDAGRWLAEHRPDVISAHGAPDWLLDAAYAHGIPWVETLHGMHDFLDSRAFEPERLRAKKISAQVAVSELVRQQYLAGVVDFPPERIVTIPNGVDERRTARVDRPAARAALGIDDEYLFVSLARYCLQKNIYGLVAAFAEVAAEHPDAHLLVAGRADDALYFAQVRRLVAELPHGDRIHLRGHCANASGLLAAADAFVLDSFFEGWPLATMEALAAGTPVVMSDVAGAREQITPERGFLVANPAGSPEAADWGTISDLRFRPQGNRAELVTAMSTLVRDRQRWAADRQRLGAQARAAFSPDLCLRRHAAVLHSAARRKEPRLPAPKAFTSRQAACR